MQRRQFLTATAATLAVAPLSAPWAMAQGGRAATLRVLSEGAPNSFDSFSVGLNRESIQISWNIYDRLVRFAYADRGDGTAAFDYFTIEGELAERFEIAEDGRSMTFHLRRDATFHDGTPVTATDVKWSLDRVVSSTIGRSQFATGSMTEPEQFVVLDDHTLRIDLPQPDRFALPNLALTYPIIVNSTLAKQHATEDDPFASEWLRTNPAGGGAFRIAEAEIGERILFERFDDWKSGPAPQIERVLWQTVPAPETRLGSLMRGDADLVQDVAPKDVASLAAAPGVKVAGVPTTSFQFIGMNNALAPFDDVRVRQAIAHALPYDDMFAAGIHGRGEPLFGGSAEVDGIRFPQPMGYHTDLDRARALLAEAGLEQGFTTTFSFDLTLATVAEPIAILIREALARINITVEIEKVPAGQLGTLLQDKKVPFYFEASTAFLADPDYFFRIFYHGETRWNFGSYDNAEFRDLVEKTRYETDAEAYEADVRRMIELAKTELPVILLWHPTLDTAMREEVEGYSFAFHRMLDLRVLRKG